MQETLERKSIKNIDFNCDLAQSYGIYKNNNENFEKYTFFIYTTFAIWYNYRIGVMHIWR